MQSLAPHQLDKLAGDNAVFSTSSKPMLVLIDESGCPGFKLGKGSTPHFVVAMVRFNDMMQAEETSANIARLRDSLGVKPEFKFCKCCDDYKDAFFECIRGAKFKARAIVVDKATLYSGHLRTNADSFYNFFVQRMLKHDNGTLAGAKIKIDGSGDREFKNALSKYLRRHLGEGKIKDIKFVDSRSDNLIQLADMCAGAIARSYKDDTRSQCWRWRHALSGALEDVWEFK